MTQLTADVEQVISWVAHDPAAVSAWNPVYRALAPRNAPESGSSPDEDALDLVLRQLTARALLTVAVSTHDLTRRARVGLEPTGATTECSEGTAASQWDEEPLEAVPTVLTDLLASAGIAPSAPRLTVAAETSGLRLSGEQITQVRAALEDGAGPVEAFDLVPDLDPRLRDAVTARGPRLSASLTLHDPAGGVAAAAVTWSRLWVRGELGLYRTDSTRAPLGAIHPVTDGDVLGTVLPVLEQGVRFATACAAPGGAR